MGHSSDSLLSGIQLLANYFSNDIDAYVEFQSKPREILRKNKINFSKEKEESLIDILKYIIDQKPKLELKNDSLEKARLSSKILDKNLFSSKKTNHSNKEESFLNYSTVDLAIDKQGQIHILEVNDRPLNFHEANFCFNTRSTLENLALDIKNKAKNKLIALLIPDFITIDYKENYFSNLNLKTLTGSAREEITIQRIRTLNQLSTKLKDIGLNPLILTKEMLNFEENFAFYDQQEIGLIYNYSELFPFNNSLNTPTFYESRERYICLNKIKTQSILENSGLKEYTIKTIGPKHSDAELLNYLNEKTSTNQNVFVKNIVGTSAIGAYKKSAAELISNLSELNSKRKKIIIQDCIDLQTLEINNENYRYDITIGILNNQPISMSFNTAALPLQSEDEHELSYLTTIGKKYSYRQIEGLSTESIDLLNRISVATINELRNEIQSTNVKDALEFTNNYLLNYKNDKSSIKPI